MTQQKAFNINNVIYDLSVHISVNNNFFMKQKLDSKHSSKSNMLSVFKSSSSVKSSISHPIVKQENLTDSQKEEIFNRDLTVANPQAPEKEVRFNYQKNEYEEVKLSTSMIICAEREGRIGIRNSNE